MFSVPVLEGMSGKALRVLNNLPGSEKKNESNGKGGFIKAYIENSSENLAKRQIENSTSLSSAPNEVEVGGACAEGGNTEVEYIESEKLNEIEDVDSSLHKDWTLRIGFWGNVISLIVKSLKNPRSAVCKTAIMTSADIFSAYRDDIIDSLDPLWKCGSYLASLFVSQLVQLLLKSSQDKRFVCEAAERALVTMTTFVSPSLLLPKLQPYLKHKNPRIRAKASMCFCRSVPQLGMEGINNYGIDKLIQIAASQLSDQLPESREAARTLALELQTAYEKYQVPQTAESEQLPTHSWEVFCQEKLSPLSAQAIIRVTSVAREGLVVGC
ncbi:hypothetical protein ACLOJK_035312 [Asimina triloba]